MEIFLPGGLSKAALQKCRDSLSYVVLGERLTTSCCLIRDSLLAEKPLHGKLNEHTTLSDYLTYTPSEGFSGTDFFTYRMQLGAINTAPATIAIVVEDEDDEGDDEAAAGERGSQVDDIEQGGGTRGSVGRAPKSRKAKDRQMDAFEIESDAEKSPPKRGGRRGPAPVEEEGEAGSRVRKEKNRISGNHTPFMQGLMKKMSLAGSPKAEPPPDEKVDDESS